MTDEPLIFERGSRGRRGIDLPPLDVKRRSLKKLLPENMIRKSIKGMPEVSEGQVVTHFTRLSQWNWSIDTGMYPLGSCTMKLNPKIHEKIVRMEGFANLHPYSPEGLSQGSLRVIWELEQYLNEICGTDEFTVAPAAGAHGERIGLFMVKAALEARGEHRTKVLIPDSAHGTNPASATFCGFEAVEIPSGPDGILEAETVRSFMDEDVAAIMITNPNTLGFFEKNILEISEIVHSSGGFVYCDGANLNALVGVARPGDMGVDLLQINLHKTFSTPHGGGGPGSGPVGVKGELAPFLPSPRVMKTSDDTFYIETDLPQSIGRIRTFLGSFSVLLRAYAYIRTLGPDGLREVAQTAVLNANYILASLKENYHIPYPGYCMHECLISDKFQQKFGVEANDIAKRLADYSLHAPTMKFPLIVHDRFNAFALLIEPTETEALEEIDHLIEAMHAIAREAKEHPELLLAAPRNAHVRRLDQTYADRTKTRNLRWRPT